MMEGEEMCERKKKIYMLFSNRKREEEGRIRERGNERSI